MFQSKRGQVTVFIIIGIVLLVIVGLTFYFRDVLFGARLEEARAVAEKIPLQFEPIRTFTDTCLQTVAEQGLLRLGQQGGLLYFEGVAFDNTSPTDSDGLMFPGSDVRVPYWRYNKAKNNEGRVVLASMQPRLADMERDLKRWIETEVGGCIGGYESFAEQGFQVTEAGETTVIVNFGPVVRVALEHPLTMVKEGTQATMKRFYTELDVDVPHLYEIANQITEAEQNYSFLEKNTLGLITLFSDINSTSFMPMTDESFDLASAVVWSKSQLKEDMKTLLLSYTPVLRYLNSRNFYSYQYPASELSDVQQRLYNDMVLPLEGGGDLEVRFNYLDFWEPFFDMNCEGELCRPQSVSLNLLNMMPFGMQRYKAVYDVSYPVWVSLYDPDALEKRGFFFNFALEANIRNNRPALDGLLPAVQSTFEKTLLCDTNQRHSGEITVEVVDEASGAGVPGAQLTFIVGDERCVMGVTDDAGVYVGKFPVALGGVVHVLAVNYVGKSVELDTLLGEEETLDVELSSYKALSLSVQKKKMLKCTGGTCFLQKPSGKQGVLSQPAVTLDGWALYDVPSVLDDTERALVSLTRISDTEDPVTVVSSVVGGEIQPIRMPAGDYEVSMQLFLDEEVVIPEQQRCQKAAGKKTCYTIPEVRFPQFMNGGLQWNGTKILRVDGDTLYGATEVTMFAISPGITDIPPEQRVIEDVDQISKIGEYSSLYYEEMQPVYE